MNDTEAFWELNVYYIASHYNIIASHINIIASHNNIIASHNNIITSHNITYLLYV